ncbi:dienelactone hydrolase family protein [Amycolatopsis pithecellobii]|uniref:Dienelactone hydrolase family protein n=1 Tax=Amycolatopsis pithecellobii TaxID=664692 RepID=A0A6N7Z562_9PSEU|nr:dienelactone hydrolase family protein [Amycolatopsis pithecellobii]MTD55654.1 dienelactone hydrolase family protein [Amycolatopsis pithecellobii]
MPVEQITIPTRDGACPASVYSPDADHGPWPAAIVYMDGFGIRPVLHSMARRLADAGLVVLLPDLYYRLGGYDEIDPRQVFATGEVRATLAPLMKSTDNARAAQDTEAFLAYLDSREDTTPKVGVAGYCMGGGMALTAAGTYPDRVSAAASFHGGSLAGDSELSPHLLAPQMRARVHIGAADSDSSYPPEMAARLVKALMEAGVDHRHELYRGTSHGWTIADLPVHDAAAAERHWTALLDLFRTSLR